MTSVPYLAVYIPGPDPRAEVMHTYMFFRLVKPQDGLHMVGHGTAGCPQRSFPSIKGLGLFS